MPIDATPHSAPVNTATSSRTARRAAPPHNHGKRLRCSFCGKTQHAVKKLITGGRVHICDECVAVCQDILAEDRNPACSFCGKTQDEVSKLIPAPSSSTWICDRCVHDQYAIIDDDVERQARKLVALVLSAIVQKRPGIARNKNRKWRRYSNIFCVQHVDWCRDENYLRRYHLTDGDVRVTMLWRLDNAGPWHYTVTLLCDGQSTRCELILLCSRRLDDSCLCGGTDGHGTTDFEIELWLKSDPPLVADDPLVWAELIDEVKAGRSAIPVSEVEAEAPASNPTPPPLKLLAAGASVTQQEAAPIRIDPSARDVYLNGERYHFSPLEFPKAELLLSGQPVRKEALVNGTSAEWPHKVFRSLDGVKFYSNFVTSDHLGHFFVKLPFDRAKPQDKLP